MTTLQSIPRPLWGAFAILLAVVMGAKGVLEMRGGKILPGTTKAAFGLFSLNVGVWYMLPLLSLTPTYTAWLPGLAVGVASVLPVSSLWLIQRFLPRDAAPKWLRPLRHRWALLGTLLLILGAFLLNDNVALRCVAFLHVFGFSAVGAVALWQGHKRTKGRTKRSILVFLIIFLIAVVMALVDAMLVGANYLTPENQPSWPGTLASAILLIALAEASMRGRLLDSREIASKGLTMLVLGLFMALVLTGLSKLAERVDDNASDPWLATIAILTLVVMFGFDELRSATQYFVNKSAWKADIGRAEEKIRRSLAGATAPADVGRAIVEHLPASRQVGGVALYVQTARDDAFDCIGSYDAAAVPRIPGAQLAPLFRALKHGPIDLSEAVSDEEDATESWSMSEPTLARVCDLESVFGNMRSGLAAAVRDREGQFVGLLLVLRRTPQADLFPSDLSALQRIADQVGMAVSRLSAYDERRRRDVELSYGRKMVEKVHEMRSPLAGILNNARLLEQADADPTLQLDVASYHRTIIHEALRAEQYISAVLEERKQSPDHTIVNRVVRDCVEHLQRDPSNAHLRIVDDLDTNVEAVPIGPVDFEHVVRNLLENAVHATGASGTVQVSTRLRPATSETPVPSVIVTVRDDGSGMSERIMNRIFRPDFTTKARGNGIGLAMTQRIVESAKGTIVVSSTPKKGSAFEMVLPIASKA